MKKPADMLEVAAYPPALQSIHQRFAHREKGLQCG